MYEQQQTTKKENKGEVDFFQLKEMMESMEVDPAGEEQEVDSP